MKFYHCKSNIHVISDRYHAATAPATCTSAARGTNLAPPSFPGSIESSAALTHARGWTALAGPLVQRVPLTASCASGAVGLKGELF